MGPFYAVIDERACGPQESRQALSDLLFQPIIVMQSTEDRLGSDAVSDGKLMPMAACRNIRVDKFQCTNLSRIAGTTVLNTSAFDEIKARLAPPRLSRRVPALSN